MINNKRKSGLVDLLQALTRREIWLYLGWQDIRQRYRRSVLGPFWLTISTGVQIGALGFLWAELFHQDLHDFLPFFSIGLVIWSFLSRAFYCRIARQPQTAAAANCRSYRHHLYYF